MLENQNLAKNWAIKTSGKVNSTDYSSKYYASKADEKIQAAVDLMEAANTNYYHLVYEDEEGTPREIMLPATVFNKWIYQHVNSSLPRRKRIADYIEPGVKHYEIVAKYTDNTKETKKFYLYDVADGYSDLMTENTDLATVVAAAETASGATIPEGVLTELQNTICSELEWRDAYAEKIGDETSAEKEAREAAEATESFTFLGWYGITHTYHCKHKDLDKWITNHTHDNELYPAEQSGYIITSDNQCYEIAVRKKDANTRVWALHKLTANAVPNLIQKSTTKSDIIQAAYTAVGITVSSELSTQLDKMVYTQAEKSAATDNSGASWQD